MNNKTKVVVFGIDGASWNLLDPAMKRGWMPNLSSLAKHHGKGILISSTPPMTYPAWINFATGANSGKHACFSFRKHTSYTNFELVSGADNKLKPFYSYLDDAGKSCVLVNLPGAFPLNLKHGAGLATFLDRTKLDYYPENLVDEIAEVDSYQTFPDYLASTTGIADPVKEFFKLEENRFMIAKKLYRGDWDFFFYLVSVYDFMLHKLGSGRKYKDLLEVKGMEKFFRGIDSYLGWFAKHSKNHQFILMSDHGFREYTHVFYANTWLRENGYIKLKAKRFRKKGDIPPWIKILSKDAKKLNPVFGALFKLADNYPFLYSWFSWMVRTFPGVFSTFADRRVGDWGIEEDGIKTKAYVADDSFLYSKLDKKHLIELVEELKSLKLPGTKSPVFSKVRFTSEVYSGPYTKDIPAVVFEWGEVLVDYALWSDKVFVKKRNMHHQSEGIFLTYGPKMDLGGGIKVKIEDLAPTILKLFKLKIPGYMEGKSIL